MQLIKLAGPTVFDHGENYYVILFTFASFPIPSVSFFTCTSKASFYVGTDCILTTVVSSIDTLIYIYK